MPTFATRDHNMVTAQILTHRAVAAIEAASNTVARAAYLRSLAHRACERRAQAAGRLTIQDELVRSSPSFDPRRGVSDRLEFELPQLPERPHPLGGPAAGSDLVAEQVEAPTKAQPQREVPAPQGIEPRLLGVGWG